MGALDGLRVLDLSNLYSAPQIAAILGDFGADVVKIEPPAGDPLRTMGARDAGGASRTFAYANRNKRSIVLDLDAPADIATFRALLGRADVLVENLPPARQQQWRCTYDELALLAPQLVVVSVSCYGQDGPYSGRPGAEIGRAHV